MRPAGLAAFEKRTRREDRRLLVRARGRRARRAEYEERLRANAAAAEYFDSRAAVVPAAPRSTWS